MGCAGGGGSVRHRLILVCVSTTMCSSFELDISGPLVRALCHRTRSHVAMQLGALFERVGYRLLS